MIATFGEQVISEMLRCIDSSHKRKVGFLGNDTRNSLIFRDRVLTE
jgi:hypothetical protein